MNSRQKGKRGELELAEYLRSKGHDARRSQQFCGKAGDADIHSDSLGKFHLECKRVEAGNPYVWLDQAIADSKPNITPVVFHKKNRRDWIVILRADDFLKIAA